MYTSSLLARRQFIQQGTYVWVGSFSLCVMDEIKIHHNLKIFGIQCYQDARDQCCEQYNIYSTRNKSVCLTR